MTEIQLEQQGQQPDPAYSPPQESGEPGVTTTSGQKQDGPSGRFVPDVDRLSDVRAARGPLQPTVVDSGGVERIVGPAVDDNWRHRSGEPDQDEIARLERVRADNEAFRAERLAATQAPAENLKGGHEVSRAAFEAERS